MRGGKKTIARAFAAAAAVLAAAVATAWLQLQHSTDGQHHQPPNPITAPTISTTTGNTSTTIITFLMVFLIQNTQNRDNAAIQTKLDELIRASEARNRWSA